MKRLLTTLFMLLMVLVVGISALIVLVDPNDFRTRMIGQVAQKSGYLLDPGSDFRWHVWPQLSIISGRMSLTAPGAQTPLISAENMRLDVKLWPLLSHQLVVKQVILNRAVIRLTADSEKKTAGMPVTAGQQHTAMSGQWNIDINKVEVIDGVLVWQERDNHPVTVRDINLSFEQDKWHQAKLAIKSRVSRNQRELAFSMMADINLQHYPRQISADINKVTYELTGADLPVTGISGSASLQASYQDAPRRIWLNPFMLSVNNNQFTGSLSGNFGEIPSYVIELSADKLNLDAISGWKVRQADSNQPAREPLVLSPVIADQNPADDFLRVLKNLTMQLRLRVNDMMYRGLTINDFTMEGVNYQGKVRIGTLSGKSSGGDFSVPLSLDVTGKKMAILLEPVINHMELGLMLQAAQLPERVKGTFSLQGTLSGEGRNDATLSSTLQGKLLVTMNGIKLEGLNIQQLIQQAIARTGSDISEKESYERYTQVQQLKASAVFSRGKVTIDDLQANSDQIRCTGRGICNIRGQQCDMNFNVRILQGWRGEAERVKKLQLVDIPLRIYGPWNDLQYQLNLPHLLRNELQDKVQKAFSDWQDTVAPKKSE